MCHWCDEVFASFASDTGPEHDGLNEFHVGDNINDAIVMLNKILSFGLLVPLILKRVDHPLRYEYALFIRLPRPRKIAVVGRLSEVFGARHLIGRVLFVNVALHDWRFIAKPGFTAARCYDGFGAFGSIRAPMHLGNQIQSYDPDKPIVMNFYVQFNERGEDIRNQGNIGRARLLGKDFLT